MVISKSDFDPNVCNQCGKCCHVPVGINGAIINLRSVVCKYLMPSGDGTRCSVYHKRFDKAPWCLSVGEAYEQGRLPKDCPYVKEDPNYKVGMEYGSPLAEEMALRSGALVQIMTSKMKDTVKRWNGPLGE